MKAALPQRWAESPASLRDEPTTAELTGGIPCAPFRRPLWNELWFRFSGIEKEAENVVTEAGLAPSQSVLTQLRDAIKIIIARSSRTKLTAATTFYVNNNTGNDGNDGLTASTPFRTLSGAYVKITTTYDSVGYTVTLQCAAGTYDALFIDNAVGLSLVLLGNEANPAACIIDNSISSLPCVTTRRGSLVSVKGFRLQGANGGLFATQGGGIEFQNVQFATSGAHISASYNAVIVATGNYTILSGAPFHVLLNTGASFNAAGRTINIPSGVSWSSAFIYVSFGYAGINTGTVFTGAGTVGQRYIVTNNGVIDVAGAGPNYLPGSVAGNATAGGQYV